MEGHIIKEAVARIRRMEECFDELQKAGPAAIREEPALRELLRRLTEYYEGGLWLHDYALDEKGLLDTELKRGVLAQDAVYDFLESIAHYEG